MMTLKTDAITFPADGTAFAFFGRGEPGCFHCLDCCLDSGVKCWPQVSTIVTNLSRNLSGSVSKSFRLAWDIFCLVCF